MSQLCESLDATKSDEFVLQMHVVQGRPVESTESTMVIKGTLAKGCASVSASSLTWLPLLSSTLRIPAHSSVTAA